MRANEHSITFRASDPAVLSAGRCALRRGRYAGMTAFYGEPSAIIEALLTHRALPPLLADVTTMLFGPGLDGLCRVASQREASLWQRLAETIPLTNLLSEGYSHDDLAPMLQEGIAEFVAPAHTGVIGHR
jgi:hypothetical protein